MGLCATGPASRRGTNYDSKLSGRAFQPVSGRSWFRFSLGARNFFSEKILTFIYSFVIYLCTCFTSIGNVPNITNDKKITKHLFGPQKEIVVARW